MKYKNYKRKGVVKTSFWMRLGVAITDLTVFKESCKQHGIEYELNEDEGKQWSGCPLHATLRDTQKEGRFGCNTAYLVREGGDYRLSVDNDPSYSSITNRLGKNGGKLTRDYTTKEKIQQVQRAGGMINSCVEQPDGSILLKVSSL